MFAHYPAVPDRAHLQREHKDGILNLLIVLHEPGRFQLNEAIVVTQYPPSSPCTSWCFRRLHPHTARQKSRVERSSSWSSRKRFSFNLFHNELLRTSLHFDVDDNKRELSHQNVKIIQISNDIPTPFSTLIQTSCSSLTTLLHLLVDLRLNSIGFLVPIISIHRNYLFSWELWTRFSPTESIRLSVGRSSLKTVFSDVMREVGWGRLHEVHFLKISSFSSILFLSSLSEDVVLLPSDHRLLRRRLSLWEIRLMCSDMSTEPPVHNEKFLAVSIHWMLIDFMRMKYNIDVMTEWI